MAICFDSYSLAYMEYENFIESYIFFVLGGEIPPVNVAEGKQLLDISRANIQREFPLEPDIQIDSWVNLYDLRHQILNSTILNSKTFCIG